MYNLYTAIHVNKICLQQIVDLKQAIVNLKMNIQRVPKTWVIHFEWQNKKLITGSC